MAVTTVLAIVMTDNDVDGTCPFGQTADVNTCGCS